jgi:hypothetical protein
MGVMENKFNTLTFNEMSEAAKKRVGLISREFTDGFEFLKNYPRSVTFFGSSRTTPGEHYYKKAENLAQRIVKDLRYSIVTGGGPGIMEAANRGAYEAGGNSLGITIDIKDEDTSGKYLTDRLNFHYFFTRKVCLSFSAEAYLFFPGGFGTLDEFSEILTLVHTNKVQKVPIVLVGKDFWEPIEKMIRENLLDRGMIDQEDFSLWTITDDDEQIIDIIKKAPIRIWEPFKNSNEDPEKSNHFHENGRTASTLSQKNCIPCEKDTPKMTHEESQKMIKEVDHWTLLEDREIQKTYFFHDFNTAINFVNDVAKIANTEGHHPNIDLHDFKKVTITIYTHAIGGLSENDFILASKIDELFR